MPDPSPATAAVRPSIPTGQELFDMLMSHIEPELTTEGLKTIGEKYKNEAPQQLAERKKRYELAFERYDQAYEGYIQTLQSQVTRYRKVSFEQAELHDRRQEEDILQKLSKAMFPSAA